MDNIHQNVLFSKRPHKVVADRDRCISILFPSIVKQVIYANYEYYFECGMRRKRITLQPIINFIIK